MRACIISDDEREGGGRGERERETHPSDENLGRLDLEVLDALLGVGDLAVQHRPVLFTATKSQSCRSRNEREGERDAPG